MYDILLLAEISNAVIDILRVMLHFAFKRDCEICFELCYRYITFCF